MMYDQQQRGGKRTRGRRRQRPLENSPPSLVARENKSVLRSLADSGVGCFQISRPLTLLPVW